MRAARTLLSLLVALQGLCGAGSAVAVGSLKVVANVDTPALNADTLRLIYEGKVIEVDGHPVIPVNLPRGNALRKAFLAQVLTRDDENYVGYWTVRRYIGKGTPPREFDSVEKQLQFLRSTPGAVGYVDDSVDVTQGPLRTVLELQ